MEAKEEARLTARIREAVIRETSIREAALRDGGEIDTPPVKNQHAFYMRIALDALAGRTRWDYWDCGCADIIESVGWVFWARRCSKSDCLRPRPALQAP